MTGPAARRPTRAALLGRPAADRADSNGFYVTTNEFPFDSGFNGAQVYAMSKWALAAAATGGAAPAVAMINAGHSDTRRGGTWYSIQPATSPLATTRTDKADRADKADRRTGQPDRTGQPGWTGPQWTEYFLSALDFFGSADNRIAVWALTNTGSLNHARPNVQLTNLVIGSESYASSLSWGVSQKSGPTPLGTLIHGGLETLNANDDRMNQVVFANGLLWSGVNTLVGDGSRTGWRTSPSIHPGNVAPSRRTWLDRATFRSRAITSSSLDRGEWQRRRGDELHRQRP